jgi:hypothetical protein
MEPAPGASSIDVIGAPKSVLLASWPERRSHHLRARRQRMCTTDREWLPT